MRKLVLALSAVGVAAIPAAALPQDDAPRTQEDYVCAFTGECGDDEGERPRLKADRGFSLSTPSNEREPRAKANGSRRNTVRRSPYRPVPGPVQRVNLRLSFETGSARLTRAAEAQARVFAQSLQLPQLMNMTFRIEGHTDSVGSRAMNLALSQRRAQSVADFLVSLGVDRARLQIQGFGPDRPLPGHRPSDGENRRVEAVRIS